MTNPLPEALREKTVLVCVGSGGVGKTTVAASLGLRSASAELRSALVCTIDPAKRLANSLGLKELGNAETKIEAALFARADIPAGAPLYAMMLDMKRTWDDLVARNAPPDRREKILNSRFYQALSTRLAGSQEYIAMEKLAELRSRRDYELVVLDTPPTAHALDFLDAPNRILDFLDTDSAKWLLTPALAAGRIGLKFFSIGSSYAAKTLSKFIGTETLQELAVFMESISTLNEGFRQRALQVRELLSAPATSFVIVTAPTPERLDEVVHFHTLLRQNKMNVAAIVVNRVHPRPTQTQLEAARTLLEPLRSRVQVTLDEQLAMANRDDATIVALRQACAPTPLIFVPRFERDVHDLSALWLTSRYLVGELTMAPLPLS